MTVLQPIRGTRDLLENDVYCHLKIIEVALELAKNYGFEPIETPIFESTSVFQKTLGETSDIVGKEMYTFQDRGGDFTTLRPEGTAPVVRAIMSAGLTQTLPQKRIYWGPMFRYERPQKGRYRQFYQLGIEYMGIANPLSDVECIAFAHAMIEKLGIQNYALHLNTLGDVESRKSYREALVEYFSKYESSLSQDSQLRLKTNPLRILDSKSEQDQTIVQNAPSLKTYLNYESQQFFETVCKALDQLKIAYVLDERLVRGLDYYCHTSFEFKTGALGAQDAFGGGGRYDGLMQQMGGPSMPAVGWAMGMDRLALIMPNSNNNTQFCAAVIPVGEDDFASAFNICQMLRANNVSAQIMYANNLGKRFKQADKQGALHAVVVGANEMAQNCVKVKKLSLAHDHEKKEDLVAINELVNFLRGAL